MQGLGKAVEGLREQNRNVATYLCLALEDFRRNPSPERFGELQDFIRAGQMACEDELSRLDRIDKKRRERYSAARARNPSLGPQIKEQYDLLEARRHQIETDRRVLRQAGDALVWLLTNGNPRIIAPLYSPQTHRIPRGVGLAGTVSTTHRLHATGRFYAVENDLVRCLGTGDVTVFAADRIGWEPLTLELKSKGELAEGAELGVQILTGHSDAPEHKGMVDEITDLLDLEDVEEGPTSTRIQRQVEEIMERTRRVFDHVRSGADPLRSPSSPHWETMARVIERGLACGESFDSTEAGGYKWAVRNRPGDDVEAALLSVHTRMHRLARMSEVNTYATASTSDLATVDDMSTYTRPVPLWELPLPHRVAILTEEVVVGHVRPQGQLQGLLRRNGVDVEEVPGGVRLFKDGVERSINQLEWLSLSAFTSITGGSAADAVDAIIERFASTAGNDAE